MEVIPVSGGEALALVFLVRFPDGRMCECVESTTPGVPRERKWVLIVSTLAGCPVGCPMCDAGALPYQGCLSAEEVLGQIDHLVRRRFPDGAVPTQRFKIQFARIGEPALNPAVLDALDLLPTRFRAPGLFPALSTIAPKGREAFFERLREVKDRRYVGRFQLQFSVHSTAEAVRGRLIPIPHWSLEEVAAYGERFFRPGDRKVTLNFAAMEGVPVDAGVVARLFDPDRFLIKITPLNPTLQQRERGLANAMNLSAPDDFGPAVELRHRGYDVIVSVGELRENAIGSNCGQHVRAFLERGGEASDAYGEVNNRNNRGQALDC